MIVCYVLEQGWIVLFSFVFGEFYSKSNLCACSVSWLSVGAKCGSFLVARFFGEVTGGQEGRFNRQSFSVSDL